MLLRDRVVVISGGAGALGQRVARVASAHGAKVVLVDRVDQRPAALSDLAYIGGVDSSVPSEAKAALVEAAGIRGRLDAVVNLAGGFAWEPVESGDIETWDRLYRINLRTAVAMSQAAVPFLRRHGGGRIVNVGAASARRGSTGIAAYAASKSGVARLTEAMADELRDQAITVNAVLPSIIDTPANRSAMPDVDFTSWVPPEDLGELISFLLSARAASITGALIPIVNRTL